MSAQPIQTVVFDLGGVLLRHYTAWDQSCLAAGVPMAERFRDPKNFSAMMGGLNEWWEKGLLDQDHFLAELCHHTAGQYTPDQALAVLDAWVYAMHDGAMQAVQRVRELGLGTALLTNTNARHWEIFQATPDWWRLISGFDHIFASHILGYRKPEPQIYDIVEAQLNLPPAAIAYFEDNAGYVETARKRGWNSHLIDPSGNIVRQVEFALRSMELVG